MTISIMQPTYLPWIGYFKLINNSDKFVFLDSVKFEEQSWQRRNKLIINNGKEKYYSIPISTEMQQFPQKKMRGPCPEPLFFFF